MMLLPVLKKIRILAGLNVDRRAFEIIEEVIGQMEMNFESIPANPRSFFPRPDQGDDEGPDSYNTELGVKKFIELGRSTLAHG